jgi:hypothetical protein
MMRSTIFLMLLIVMNPVSRSCEVSLEFKDGMPLLSDRAYLVTFNWKGVARENWQRDAVTIKLKSTRSHKMISQHHFPPVHDFKSEETDWDIAYSTYIFIPAQRQDEEFSVSILKGDSIFPDLMVIPVLQSSAAPKPNEGPPTGLVYGWYDLEKNLETGESWRWMAGLSRLTLQNPCKPCTLLLIGRIPQEKLSQASGLHVILNGCEIDYFVPGDDDFTVRYDLPLFILGTEPLITLDLKTDREFRPSEDGISRDDRNLGLELKTLQFK